MNYKNKRDYMINEEVIELCDYKIRLLIYKLWCWDTIVGDILTVVGIVHVLWIIISIIFAIIMMNITETNAPIIESTIWDVNIVPSIQCVSIL